MTLTPNATKGCLLTAFCFICSLAFCQDSSTPFSLAARFHQGFFLANKPKAVLIRDSYASFGEISMDIQTDGKAYWQWANRYPRIGIAAFYGSPGSKQYLGNMAGIFPYASFTLAKSRFANIGFRLGTGIAWVQKPFDVQDNPRNLVIGTYLNSCISMLLDAEFSITHHISASAGFSFTHISNGLWKVPNLGLNMPALTLGVRYKNTDPVYKKTASPVYERGPHWQVFASSAVKEGAWIESPHYMLGILNAEVMFTQKNGHEIGGGLLFTYDPSLTSQVPDEPILEFDNGQPKIQAGLYAAYEHNLGRISIPLQMGAYFYNKYSINRMFQVIGLRYAINKHWKALFQLKTHLGKADHIDWGIGYRFK